LSDIKKGIERAVEVGLSPVKINMTILRQTNETEIHSMMEFTATTDTILQLIEVQDIPAESVENLEHHRFLLKELEELFNETAVKIVQRTLHNRRQYHVSTKNGVARVEIVRSMHNAEFCRSCTRLRVTSDGMFKPCLYRTDNLVHAKSYLVDCESTSRLLQAYSTAIKHREPYWQKVKILIQVTKDDFSIDDVIANTRTPDMGAIVIFLGTVRNVSRGVTVERLEFEADDSLAIEKLKEIRDNAIRKFGALDVSIVHRKGRIEIGQNIVIIAAGAGHRDQAFKSCRYAIERLKEIVPIWKQEFFEGGSHWVGETEAKERSNVRIVDISKKPLSLRTSRAEGELILHPDTIDAVRFGTTKKGNVLSVSKVAGIVAAKKTSELIPLCHQIPLSSVDISFEILDDRIRCICEVVATYSTGVEMEALVGVTTSLLNIWDMTKYLEKDPEGQYPTARIERVRVVLKEKVEL
jgi:cyclic pyranopterin phosphate synthase